LTGEAQSRDVSKAEILGEMGLKKNGNSFQADEMDPVYQDGWDPETVCATAQSKCQCSGNHMAATAACNCVGSFGRSWASTRCMLLQAILDCFNHGCLACRHQSACTCTKRMYPDLVPLDQAPAEWLMPAEGMDLALDAEVNAVTATVLETVWSTSVVIPVVGEIVAAGMLLASTFLLIWDAVQRNKE